MHIFFSLFRQRQRRCGDPSENKWGEKRKEGGGGEEEERVLARLSFSHKNLTRGGARDVQFFGGWGCGEGGKGKKESAEEIVLESYAEKPIEQSCTGTVKLG